MQPGEQLEGQMDITKYPEYMPDADDDSQENGATAAGDTEDPEKPEKTGAETESAEAAGAEDTGAVIRDADGLEWNIENQTNIIMDDLQTMDERCRQHNWDGLIQKAYQVIDRAEAIKNMEEMWNE